MLEVDCRGFSCPIPVVRTRKALSSNPQSEIAVLVDSAVARENVARLAVNSGYSVKVEENGDGFRLTLSPSEN